MVYEIFARKTRGEPLRHIGNLNAPDDELAKVYAFNTYDEEKWFDMYITQRDCFLEVFNRLDSDGGDRAAQLAERASGAAGETEQGA